jgi:hypothetical protein
MTTAIVSDPLAPGLYPTCCYCPTSFKLNDLFRLYEPDGEVLIRDLARCPNCFGIHVLGQPGEDDNCQGRTECLTNGDAWHPTHDNTPWGELMCRVCSYPNPMTHLTHFIGQLTERNRAQASSLTHIQEANTRYAQDNAALRAQLASLGEAHAIYRNSTDHERQLWSREVQTLEEWQKEIRPVVARLHDLWAQREWFLEHGIDGVGIERSDANPRDLSPQDFYNFLHTNIHRLGETPHNTERYLLCRVISAVAHIAMEKAGREPVGAEAILTSSLTRKGILL